VWQCRQCPGVNKVSQFATRPPFRHPPGESFRNYI